LNEATSKLSNPTAAAEEKDHLGEGIDGHSLSSKANETIEYKFGKKQFEPDRVSDTKEGVHVWPDDTAKDMEILRKLHHDDDPMDPPKREGKKDTNGAQEGEEKERPI